MILQNHMQLHIFLKPTPSAIVKVVVSRRVEVAEPLGDGQGRAKGGGGNGTQIILKLEKS